MFDALKDLEKRSAKGQRDIQRLQQKLRGKEKPLAHPAAFQIAFKQIQAR